MSYIAYKTNFAFTSPAFIVEVNGSFGNFFTFSGNKNRAYKFDSAAEAQDAIDSFEDTNSSNKYYIIGENEPIINLHYKIKH